MTEHVGEVKVRVRYAETDQMGVVYYANYLIWMEVGRVEFCKARGFNYRDMEIDDGIFLAVAEANCQYRYPARYDDEIIVRTHLKNARESLVHFGYEIVRSTDGTLLAEGETTHVVTDAQMKRRTIPEKYMRAFCEAAGRNFLTTEDKKH